MLGSHRRWSRRAAPGCPPCNASQHWARRLDEPGFTNRRALPVQANAYMRATQAATAPQNRALRTTRRSKHNHLHLFVGFWRHQAPVPTGRTCRSRINRHSRGGSQPTSGASQRPFSRAAASEVTAKARTSRAAPSRSISSIPAWAIRSTAMLQRSSAAGGRPAQATGSLPPSSTSIAVGASPRSAKASNDARIEGLARGLLHCMRGCMQSGFGRPRGCRCVDVIY